MHQNQSITCVTAEGAITDSHIPKRVNSQCLGFRKQPRSHDHSKLQCKLFLLPFVLSVLAPHIVEMSQELRFDGQTVVVTGAGGGVRPFSS